MTIDEMPAEWVWTLIEIAARKYYRDEREAFEWVDLGGES